MSEKTNRPKHERAKDALLAGSIPRARSRMTYSMIDLKAEYVGLDCWFVKQHEHEKVDARAFASYMIRYNGEGVQWMPICRECASRIQTVMDREPLSRKTKQDKLMKAKNVHQTQKEEHKRNINQESIKNYFQ